MTTKIKKTPHSKKNLRDHLSLQLHGLLVSFKESVNEKKLHKLVKKASKLLADGLHHKPAVAPVKKKAPVKAAVKKAPVKKIAKKK